MRSSKRANAQLRAQVERLQAENQVLQKLHAVAAPAPAAAPAATDGAAIGAAGPSVLHDSVSTLSLLCVWI